MVTIFTDETAIELMRPPLPGLRQIVSGNVLIEYDWQRQGWAVKQLGDEHEWLDVAFVQMIEKG